MNRLIATSRCECQAILSAEVTGQGQAIHGEATRRGIVSGAPAHSIGGPSATFDIAWMCPFCGRNTQRAFHVGALRTVVVPEAPAA